MKINGEVVISNTAINILLIEDDSGDAGLIREMLSDVAGKYTLTTAGRLAAGLSLLEEGRFDMMLLDLGLPDSSGIETLQKVQDKAPTLPIVVLTGLSDEEFAVQAIGLGAQDYLVKGQFDDSILSRSMHYAIERKKAAAALNNSEYKYRTLLENIPEKIFVKDRNSVYISCNNNYAHDLKISPSQISGMTDYDFYPEELAEKYRADDKRIIETGDKEDIEEKYIVNGSEHIVHTIKTPVRDDKGNIASILGVFRDITDRKNDEELIKQSLREQEALLTENRQLTLELERRVIERTKELDAANKELNRQITEISEAKEALRGYTDTVNDLYNNAPCGYHSLDKDGVFVLINDTELSWLGYTRDEMIGMKRFTDIITPGSVKEFRAKFPVLKKRGWVRDLEFELVRKDDSILPVLLSATAIKDAEGNFVMSRSTTFDIARRKELEDEKTKLQSEAIRAAHLASIGELAAGVAHEINNPLTGIISCAEMLLDKYADGSREKEIADRIIREGVRVSDIVKSLLSFARQGGEEKRPVRIEDILYEVLALTRAMLKKDSIEIKLSSMPEFQPVMANFQQIEQVFLNVINNSRYALNQKYGVKSGDKQIRITFGTIIKNNRHYVRTIFLDNGTGISRDVIDKVADPFFSTKPAGDGTGLGLSISHGIISDHNGMIKIESVEGDFTTVIIDLPVSGQVRQNEK